MRQRDPQAGRLLSREERFQIRVLARDLTRKLDRCQDAAERDRLERALAGLKREQQLDRQTRPRSSKSR